MKSGKVAVVTGGAGGLGRAAADRLRADGATVHTIDLKGADFCIDVTDVEALTRLAGDLGSVDVLVNSAGVMGVNKPLLSTVTSDWRRVIDINVMGTVNAMLAFVPGMKRRGWGRVVNVASMAGKDGNVNLAPYSASKAAVIALTKSAGKELATSGVLVNVIVPAAFETEMNGQIDPEAMKYFIDLIPMKRMGRPEEFAELVAFLGSDRVSFSTGAAYDISGGRGNY